MENEEVWKVVIKCKLILVEVKVLVFVWKVVKYVKFNVIVVVNEC